MKKIEGNAEAWESGLLGESAEHSVPVDPLLAVAMDEALGSRAISIRLPVALINSFKLMAGLEGLGYQTLMRKALERFAEGNMKLIVQEAAASTLVQPAAQVASPASVPPQPHRA